MEQIENRIPELMAKKLAGEIDRHELVELESWIAQSDANLREWENYRETMWKVDAHYRARRYNTDAAWQNVQKKLDPGISRTLPLQTKRKEGIALFYKYAAVLVVAVLLGSVGYFLGFRNGMPAVFSEVISAKNQVLQEYVLPDGSTVALNANSKLRFPKEFRSDIREVTIEGEAFFDVKPNPEKPFVINAGNAQVKVLGTSFSVSAYPGNETVEVIVATGKVSVVNRIIEKQTEIGELLLVPGEKGTLFALSQKLEKSVNTDPNYLSWKTHDLIFDEVPLGEVIRCLEKTYRIRIDLAEPGLNDLLYEGHFDQKPADFVLDVIRLTFNLELTGGNEHYTLSGRTKTQ